MALRPISDAALAALYLRRLGFNEAEAVELVTAPARGRPGKALLSELIRRHVLRVPFENLEQHALPLTGSGLEGTRPPTPAEDRLARLGQVKRNVERLAAGACGGICFDLNPAFAWLLRQLGAQVRLAMAWVWHGDAYLPKPSHCVVIVELPEGPVLADPGFSDPPRTALCIEGDSADSFATYRVADNPDESCTSGFTKVLRRCRGSASLCRHVQEPDSSELDAAEAQWTNMYAFRPEDDLAYNSEELRAALQAVLEPGVSLFSRARLVCLATPTGHVVLSERRMRRVDAGVVAEEVSIEDEEAWMKQAQAIFSMPLLCNLGGGKVCEATASSAKRPGAAEPGPKPLRQLGGSNELSPSRPPVPGLPAHQARAQASQESATSKAKNLGVLDATSIAVGGAGAGGGLGLNAPGFGGARVQNFTGNPNGKKAIEISPEVRASWLQVMDDSDPLAWIYCVYSPDGKALVLSKKGTGGLNEFKEALGDTIAWGGFRCYGVDRRGHLECKRPKFIFVQHKPEAASAMRKAKQGSHKGDVKETLSGAHLDITVETLEDLDEQVIITKLQAATGAHKPNGYEFEDGVFIEADFYGLGIGRNCRSETARN